MPNSISAPEAAKAFRYATDWFAVFVEETNALNVYPVPDGDTGTNMHLTLQSVRRELDISDTSKMEDVARAISYGSLLGARGNSGVITSQILKGMSDVFRTASSITPEILIKAFDEGAKTGYKAVMKPVEGTILTVIKGLAEGAKNGSGSIENVLEAALEGGGAALKSTPDLLPVLKAAGVVDAGGAGLIRLIEGLHGYVLNIPLPEPPKIEKYAQVEMDNEEFGYCTEFLLEDVEEPIEVVRQAVASLGDSLLVVGAEGYVKGHIHTNDPDGLLALVGRFGKMVRTKVEDMSQQHTEILSMAGAADEAPPVSGLVAVASGWGLVKAFRGLGARVVAGGQTANPSVQDILDAIKSLPNPEVIVLPNNSNVLMSANQAAGLAEGKKVVVIPTKTMGSGLAAGVVFQSDSPIDELIPQMERAASQAVTLEVTKASRTVEINGISVVEGEPIGLIDDKLILTSPTTEQCLMDLINTSSKTGQYEILTVFHSSGYGPEEVSLLKSQLEEGFPDFSVEIHSGGPDMYDFLAVVE